LSFNVKTFMKCFTGRR